MRVPTRPQLAALRVLDSQDTAYISNETSTGYAEMSDEFHSSQRIRITDQRAQGAGKVRRMLIEFTPPAEMTEHRALRLLNLAATNLFDGEHGDDDPYEPWLRKVELPKDPPMAPHRANSSSASTNSARSIAPKAGGEARTILDVLADAGRPLTAAHITRRLVNGHREGSDGDAIRFVQPVQISPNQVAARLWSLRRAGWVEYVPDEGAAPTDGLFIDAEGFRCEATALDPQSGKVRHFGRVQRLTVKARRMLEASNREIQT